MLQVDPPLADRGEFDRFNAIDAEINAAVGGSNAAAARLVAIVG